MNIAPDLQRLDRIGMRLCKIAMLAAAATLVALATALLCGVPSPETNIGFSTVKIPLAVAIAFDKAGLPIEDGKPSGILFIAVWLFGLLRISTVGFGVFFIVKRRWLMLLGVICAWMITGLFHQVAIDRLPFEFARPEHFGSAAAWRPTLQQQTLTPAEADAAAFVWAQAAYLRGDPRAVAAHLRAVPQGFPGDAATHWRLQLMTAYARAHGQSAAEVSVSHPGLALATLGGLELGLRGLSTLMVMIALGAAGLVAFIRRRRSRIDSLMGAAQPAGGAA